MSAMIQSTVVPPGAGGPTGPGVTGPTGPASSTTGPTGASQTGPTGAVQTGPTGAASTQTGPTGAVQTGPTGAASTQTGPTGAAVTGPTGAATTGPTGPTMLTYNAQNNINYTVAASDVVGNVMIEMNATGPQTLYIPPNISGPFGIGSLVNVVAKGAGAITVQAALPATTSVFSTAANPTGPILRKQYSSASLAKEAADAWYVVGDIQ
jgi:hypothetical protein